MKRGSYAAFTLAEMMVVMLILSIILAAFAPVMTTRNKINSGSPWAYSTKNNSDAYYGTGGNQMAMIGQPARVDTDPIARLLLSTDLNPLNSNQSHIVFKRGNNTLLGRLYMNDTNLVISDNYNSLSGTNNTMIGRGALKNLVSGSNNTAIGRNSLTTASSTSDNTAVGANALHAATGAQNVAIGSNALTATTTGQNNLAIGHNALVKNTTGSKNFAFGTDSLSNNEKGSNNMGIGPGTLSGLSSGSYNQAFGENVLNKTTTGSHNIAMGQDAMRDNIGGSQNVGIGYNSLRYIKGGSNNVGIGYLSLDGVGEFNGSNNIGISPYSLYYITDSSSNNIALGHSSQYTMRNGNGNVSMGQNSLYALNTGSNNTAIGTNACQNITGSNKTCIGASSGPSGTDASDSIERIFIGSRGTFAPYYPNASQPGSSNYTTNGILELHKSGNRAVAVINADLMVKGRLFFSTKRFGYEWSHRIVEVEGNNDSGEDAKIYHPDNHNFIDSSGSLQSYSSDSRLKYIGKESISGLGKIKQIKVFNYTFKKDEKKTPRVGVIAQDLQKIFPDAVTKNEDGYLQIRMEDMFYAAVNAIKELDRKFQELAAKVNKIDTRIGALEKENKILKSQNETLMKQNKEIINRLSKLEKK